MANLRLLLDANLSPKVARRLSQLLALDVVSIHGQFLGQLPDAEILNMARSSRRVIVTLDRDFEHHFHQMPRLEIGIVYLNLSNSNRTIPSIVQRLYDFLSGLPENDDLSGSLVTIGDEDVRRVHRVLR
ncbi:MAG: DUF5615 family PIN-like protein [Thermomicrobiales bacterium]|nr:DUF5615 family PIN-like protein [Thermomicrobiales bacterium]